VRAATVTFRWKPGAVGGSHIALTENRAGTAEVFNGVGVALRGVEVAAATAAEVGVVAPPAPGLTFLNTPVEVAEGREKKFQVRLITRPVGGDVVVSISSVNTYKLTVSPESLTFTAGNWDKKRTVTVTGVNNYAAEADEKYKINFEVDDEKTGAVSYHGKTASVSVTVMDDEPAVVLSVTPESLCRVATNPPVKLNQSITLTARVRDRESETRAIVLTLEKEKISNQFATAGYTVSDFPEKITISAEDQSADTTFTITADTIGETKFFQIEGTAAPKYGGIAPDPINVVSVSLPIHKFDLDVDGSGDVNVYDGIMAMRYLMGVDDDKTLTAGQSNTHYSVVAKSMANCRDFLDVDENQVSDQVDGALVARYLFSLRGEDLVKGLGFPSEDAPGLEANINKLCPLREDGMPVCE
ncbi:MAG: hypothetical protein MPL62_16415, partial [Alphaproteobacteria bacterium]|nr:hypothetical protein [Alphaproteobacteria bacterium]